MYEFVTKKEYSPIRAEVEQIIKSVQKMLKQENKNLNFSETLNIVLDFNKLKNINYYFNNFQYFDILENYDE